MLNDKNLEGNPELIVRIFAKTYGLRVMLLRIALKPAVAKKNGFQWKK